MDISKIILGMATGVIPLVPLVMSLVQWSKVMLRTSDERLINGIAMLWGLLLGGGFMYAVSVPVDFPSWFLLVVYGIMLGLSASGLFKVGADMAERSKGPTILK